MSARLKLAERLAENVRAYWAQRGHTVRVWVEPVRVMVGANADRPEFEWAIRSDLVNALPRKSLTHTPGGDN